MAAGGRKINNKQPQVCNSSGFVIRSINLFLFGNIYVALGAVCLIQSTIIQLGFTDHLFPYSILVFFSTLFIYNLQRIFYKPQSDNSLHSIRRKWIFENQNSIKALCLIGFSGVCISLLFMDIKIFLYLLPLLLLSIAYFIPFVKLRKNAWLKLLILVSVWTMATTVVPILLNNSGVFTKNDLLHVLARFSFMIAICIPFDIRDLKIDEADTISTLSRLLGENRTRWLAFIFIILYCLLIFLELQWKIINTKIFIALLLSAFINGILVVMSNSKRSEYFYVAALDGTMILQGIVLIISGYL
ncbi:MAG: hypothetical protein ACT4ON_09175 [Bacteroidota bacterium]